jgi:hypothetical protein
LYHFIASKDAIDVCTTGRKPRGMQRRIVQHAEYDTHYGKVKVDMIVSANPLATA